MCVCVCKRQTTFYENVFKLFFLLFEKNEFAWLKFAAKTDECFGSVIPSFREIKKRKEGN
jgi:phosphopantetheinyl transferase